MKTAKETSGDQTIVTLSGELTLPYSDQLKAVLLETLHDGDKIVVKLEDVTEVDLSALQILCSAHRSSVASGKCLILDGADDFFRDTAKRAGFSRHMGCAFNPNEHCLWIGGEA